MSRDRPLRGKINDDNVVLPGFRWYTDVDFVHVPTIVPFVIVVSEFAPAHIASRTHSALFVLRESTVNLLVFVTVQL